MAYTAPTTTGRLALTEVVTRLGAHARVEGILPIGSLAENTVTSFSDYDLAIVRLPERNACTEPPWYVGIGPRT